MPFRFKELTIPRVILIEPKIFSDERGLFAETYKYSDFAAFGITERFVQDSHSRSTRGVLRGLHYQRAPKAQAKLVRVVVGKIFDVIVDLRKGEPTYGKSLCVELSAENRRTLFVPPWCAHGFCVLSEEAEIIYKMTEEYAPELETGILWNDPDLAIDWPEKQPSLSLKDQTWPRLRDREVNIGPEGRRI